MRHHGLGGVSRIQTIQTASVEVFASRQPTGSRNIEVLVFRNVLTMFWLFLFTLISRRWSYHIWSYLFICIHIFILCQFISPILIISTIIYIITARVRISPVFRPGRWQRCIPCVPSVRTCSSRMSSQMPWALCSSALHVENVEVSQHNVERTWKHNVGVLTLDISWHRQLQRNLTSQDQLEPHKRSKRNPMHNRTIAAIATSFHLISHISPNLSYWCYRVWSCIDLYTSPYFAHFESFQRLDSWWFIQIPRCFRANSPRLKDTQSIVEHFINCLICIHLSCPDSFWPRSKTRHDSKPHSQTFANRRCKKCASAKFWVQGSVPCLCSLLRLVHFDLFQSRRWKYCFADSIQPKH